MADEVPADSAGRVSAMKQRVESFVSPLREAVQGVPDDAVPYEIKFGDWENTHWPSQNRGRVTLVGDAAHAMTMCEYSYPKLGNWSYSSLRGVRDV